MSANDIYEQGILIVDDEEHVRLLVTEVLEEAGFKKLYDASNGLECVNTLQENRESILLIIMDIRLTNIDWDEKRQIWMWNGLETIRHLTNMWDEVVGFLFHTAFDAYREEASEIGTSTVLNLGYYVKDFDMEPFVAAVEKNVQLMIDKRNRILSEKDTYLVKYIEKHMSALANEYGTIKKGLLNIESDVLKIKIARSSILYDIGKSVIVAIILGIFVILYLKFNLGDIIKPLLPSP